jgi:hypothetical protein
LPGDGNALFDMLFALITVTSEDARGPPTCWVLYEQRLWNRLGFLRRSA